MLAVLAIAAVNQKEKECFHHVRVKRSNIERELMEARDLTVVSTRGWLTRV
jgi:hypothetical protein